MNLVVLQMTEDGEQAIEWNIDFLHTKDEFPNTLERFLNEGDRGHFLDILQYGYPRTVTPRLAVARTRQSRRPPVRRTATPRTT